MKRLKKSTAIVLTVLLSFIMLAGVILSFVPMTFGAETFVSFSRSISISQDISGGMYGEYTIKTENPTKADIVSSMKKIKEVFEDSGFKNVNVYAVGNSKIRVDVSYPRGGNKYAETYAALSNVNSGAFSLRSNSPTSTSENANDAVILEGKSHVKEVNVYTNNGTKYVSVVFNEEGQKKYEELCKKVLASSSSQLYMVIGESSSPISVPAGNSDYTNFTLRQDDYSGLVALQKQIKLGCTEVELDTSFETINTMSASLTAGESASSDINDSFFTSTAYVVAVSSIFVVMVMGIALFAVKFGYFSLVILFTLLTNIFLFLATLCLIPSVELGLSGMAGIIIGMAAIYLYAFKFASRVKYEYNQGKSLAASLETAYKKLLPSTLIENITLFISALILFAFSFGEMTSFSIIFAICSFLSLITNLLLIPLIIKILISFDVGAKLFMLKKHDNLALSDIANVESDNISDLTIIEQTEKEDV